MENASKALIIAGAILLSILIIALGIFIYNQAKSAINTDTLTSTEISTFNSNFTEYEGKILGSNVRSFLSVVNSNGSTNQDSMEKLPTIFFMNNGESAFTVAAQGGYSSTFTAGSNGAADGTFSLGDARNDFDISTYQTGINSMKNKISNSHNYTVTIVGYTEAGYIAGIAVDYKNDY